MKNFYSLSSQKKIALFFLHLILMETGFPTVSWALTGGPAQPEFSGFQPAGVTDMVNKFTGDFNYSIPVLEVPGPQGSSYPLTLAYRSGVNAEDDASWVGLGWSLSPGAINRSARGLPDDFCNEPTTYFNKVPDNYTLTAGVGIGTELFSSDHLRSVGAANANLAIRYNNYMGFGYTRGLGISLGKGIVNLGVSESDGRSSYSASVNPIALITALTQGGGDNKGNVRDDQKNVDLDRAKYNGFSLKRSVDRLMQSAVVRSGSTALFGGGRGALDFNEGSQNTHASSYSGMAYNVRFGATLNPFPVPVGVTLNQSGSYAWQHSDEEIKLKGFGYLYSADAVAGHRNQDGAIASDYYTEKDSPYNKRDVFLGVAFANNDIYDVSGEGIGGAFQVHHPSSGDFSPNTTSSSTTLIDAGADVSLGWTFGAGANISAGSQTLQESSWDEAQGKEKSLNKFSSLQGGRGSYFRFVNDLGGTAGNDLDNDAPVAAGLQPSSKSPGSYTLDKTPLQKLTGQEPNRAAIRPAQGSHIGQHTVAQMRKGPAFRYCRRTDIAAIRHIPLSATGSPQDSALAEFRITNESGRQYTYGLPVYSQAESTLQYGLKGGGYTLNNNFQVYTNRTDIKVGEQRASAYASNYLLTEITTPDYIDRNLNGPDEQDFGAYTTFSYVKKSGGKGAESGTAWYHWRLPYTGHVYEANSLSDPDDDMGAVSEGEKELCYLQAVHTKTHTAIFTISLRPDGVSAARDGGLVRTDPAAKGSELSYKLDKIDLYNNQDVVLRALDPTNPDKLTWQPKTVGVLPIKTVVFSYDYSLCQKTPNSTSLSGKLTLTRLSTIYNGVTRAGKALTKPYQFQYTYPDYTTYPDRYEAKGTTAGRHLSQGYTGLAENPDYTPYCLDAWGSYQPNGARRYGYWQTWPSQEAPPPGFDPAAWQLKVIKLPSEGEIHVQYEADDYAYVQDKPVHALVALDSTNVTSNANATETSAFVLDLNTVGVTTNVASSSLPAAAIAAITQTNNENAEACRKLIQSLYVDQHQKIFFKFLYHLVGNSSPQLATCNKDYISGYVGVSSVSKIDATHLQLTVGDGSGDYTLPRQVCQDFTQTQRLGKLQNESTNCSPYPLGFAEDRGNAANVFRQFLAWAPNALKVLNQKDDLCKFLNPRLSYFKIPLPTSKRGGGLRVKRLLTFDKGLDGVPVLYGSEFEYKAFDKLTGRWRSSGVATTEPAAMRVENALVSFIPRLQQGAFTKIIAGPDRKQAEGPIGESLLPGASVGYSRVTVKNIHSGKTNPGYSISEYYTCKDAPMQWRMTNLTAKPQYFVINAGVFNYVTNNTWSTQGFSFILNNMHGQPKREATYAGTYDDINAQAHSTLVSEQRYQYFDPNEPGDKVLVQGESETQPASLGNGPNVYPGKEVVVTTAQRAVRDNTVDGSIEGDLQFTPLVVAMDIWLTASLSASVTNAEFYSHTTSKVIRYPAIVKQITSYHDGVTETVENLAFDRYTGQPVAVRTSDTGSGGYLKQDVKAAWVYGQLRGKAANEGLVLSAVTSGQPIAQLTASATTNGAFYLQPSTADCTLLASVGKGDVLALGEENSSTYASTLYFADAPDIARKRIRLYPFSLGGTTPAAGSVTKVSVLFSGNTNELQAQAGSTTYHDKSLKNLTFADLTPKPDVTAPFAKDLQTAINGLSAPTTPGVATTSTFTLSAQYTKVNVAGFADRLDPVDRRGAASATIKNVNFTVYRDADGNSVRIQLLSFDFLQSSGTYKTIK